MTRHNHSGFVATPAGLAPNHFLKLAGFYCIYKALIEIGLTRPYDLLFRELKQSEMRYRHLYLDTPVMLHSIDREGRLVSVSNYWLDTLGYEKSEVLGRSITEFHTEASRRYAEEVVIPEFFRTGSCKEVPYQFVKKNGEILDVLLSAIAERNDEGKVVRSLAVMVDVTDRKRAEESLRESAEWYGTLFVEALDGICIADATTGLILDCNQAFARMVGYSSREEVLSISAWQLYVNIRSEYLVKRKRQMPRSQEDK